MLNLEGGVGKAGTDERKQHNQHKLLTAQQDGNNQPASKWYQPRRLSGKGAGNRVMPLNSPTTGERHTFLNSPTSSGMKGIGMRGGSGPASVQVSRQRSRSEPAAEKEEQRKKSIIHPTLSMVKKRLSETSGAEFPPLVMKRGKTEKEEDAEDDSGSDGNGAGVGL